MRWLPLCLALSWLVSTFAAEPPQPAVRININLASAEILETLPGVGPKLAKEIIAARPFRTLEELDRVKGIGPVKLAKIRDKIFIGPTVPQLRARGASSPPAPTNSTAKINLNTAPKEELDKLPGIGPKRAEAIIKARPFTGIEDLRRIKGLSAKDLQKLKDLVSVR